MKNEMKSGYDLTTRQPMGAILSDGMGALVADLRPFLDIVIKPGQPAPFQGLDVGDVKEALEACCWFGEGRLGMTTMKDHLRDGRGGFVPDEDLRELFAFCIEPGMPFPSAPFAGLTSDEIADAFAEEAIAMEQARKPSNSQ